MFLAISKPLIQVLIIGGLIIIFLLSYILNRKTKVPKGVEVPEKCVSCTVASCFVKINDVEKTKETLREVMDKCEDEDEKN